MTAKDKHNALLATCFATLFVSTALLGLTIWLQVAALKFEIRTLRGRIERLERSHELHIELKALSEAVPEDKYSRYNGIKTVISSSSKNENFKTVYENNAFIDLFKKLHFDQMNDSKAQNNRLKREAVNANKKFILPLYQESQNSFHNWTRSLPLMPSNNASYVPSTSNRTVLRTPEDKTPSLSLRKNKNVRYRKKHKHRSGLPYVSKTEDLKSSEAAIINRPSRVMKTDTGFLGSIIVPPSLRSQPIYKESRASPTVVRPFTRPRRRRPNHEAVESMDEVPAQTTRNRQTVAAHYHGDVSGYSNYHEHYDGNGRLRYPDGVFRDWAPVVWMHTLGMNNHISLAENGVVNVQTGGLYFIYAQIYYVDTHDTNGFRVYVNSLPILHCTSHSSSVGHSVKANTCFSASIAYLYPNDNVSISDVEGLRYTLFEHAKSFFGLFKVGDVTTR